MFRIIAITFLTCMFSCGAQDYVGFMPAAMGLAPSDLATEPSNWPTGKPWPYVDTNFVEQPLRASFELNWSNTSNGVYQIWSSSFLTQPFALLETLKTNTCVVSNSFPSQFFAAFMLAPYSMTDSWTASVSNDVIGYNLYYGGAPGIFTNEVEVGKVTNVVINGLAAGTYYFAAAAVNSSGYRSPFSTQLTDAIPMLAVTGLKISPH